MIDRNGDAIMKRLSEEINHTLLEKLEIELHGGMLPEPNTLAEASEKLNSFLTATQTAEQQRLKASRQTEANWRHLGGALPDHIAHVAIAIIARDIVRRPSYRFGAEFYGAPANHSRVVELAHQIFNEGTRGRGSYSEMRSEAISSAWAAFETYKKLGIIASEYE